MKQPELGLKITQFRKEKGLTQQELVDLCNINVRTIQRIEAGEVVPRSYTVKSILAALDKGLEDIQLQSAETNENLSSIKHPKKLLVSLKTSLISGAIFLVLYLAEIFLLTIWEQLYPETLELTFMIFKIILAVVMALFYLGFYRIAQGTGQSLLKLITLVMISFGIIANLTEVIIVWQFEELGYFSVLVIECIIFGVLGILFGIASLKLKPIFGSLLQVLGIAEIIVGILLVSIIFQIGGAFLSIGLITLELYVLYHFREMLKNVD